MRIFQNCLALSLLFLLVSAKRSRPVAAHRLVIEHRSAGFAKKQHVAVKPESKNVIVQATVGDPSQNQSKFLQPVSRSTCDVTPFDFAESLPGCKTLADLFVGAANAAAESLKRGVTNPMDMSGTGVTDTNTMDITNKILTPIMDSLLGLVEEALTSNAAPTFLNSNVCAGNFAGDFAFSDYKGVCANLPLNDDISWTVFGFAVDVGTSSPFQAPCAGATTDSSKFASFCMAIAKDCNYLPSFVFSITPIIFKCQPFDTALTASTAGASKVVTETLAVAVDSYTFGISVSNSFTRTFSTFNGNKIIDFTSPGALYSSGKFAISTDTIPSVPQFFTFGGEVVTMISISGVSDGVDQAISELEKAPAEGPEKALTAIKELVSDIDFALLYNMKLTLKFEFSSLPKLGTVLPDSDEIEIGEASVYATTGTVTSRSNTLSPGLYMYTSGNLGNVLKELLRYALQFTGEILNSIPDWIPSSLVNFDATKLADNIDTNGNSDDFGVGFATIVPDMKAAIILRAPLIISELGYIELRCSIDLESSEFKCSAKFDNNISEFFAAIGEALEEGVLWVVKQLSKWGDNFADAAEEVLLAGLSAVGDALGEALSLQSISNTLEMLEDGLLNLDTLGNIGDAVAAWGTEAAGAFLDVMDDIGDGIDSGIQIAGQYGEDVLNELGSFVGQANDFLDSAANDLSGLIGCSTSRIKSSVENSEDGVSCRSCCGAAYNMAKELKNFGDNIENTANHIIEEVGDWLEDNFNKFLEDVGILSTSSSISEHATGKKDPITRCPTYKYVEKRTKKVKIIITWKVKTSYHDLYIIPKKDCVKDRLRKARTVRNRVIERKAVRNVKVQADVDLASSMTAVGITVQQLVNNGMTCETTFDRANGETKTFTQRNRILVSISPMTWKTITRTYKVYVVPTTITCSAPVIKTDGTFGGLQTVTETLDMVMSRKSQDGMRSQLVTMETKARQKLINVITSNVPTTYSALGLPSGYTLSK